MPVSPHFENPGTQGCFLSRIHAKNSIKLPLHQQTIAILLTLHPSTQLRMILKPIFFATLAAAGLAISANAATVGAGVGILTQAGANNAFDTPATATTDQSRQNLDDKFFVTLPAGTYIATTWQYNAGQAGQVIPYLAVLTGADAYQIVAVGSTQTITGGFGVNTTVTFGGSSTFTLGAATNLYAGITNPKGPPSTRPSPAKPSNPSSLNALLSIAPCKRKPSPTQWIHDYWRSPGTRL